MVKKAIMLLTIAGAVFFLLITLPSLAEGAKPDYQVISAGGYYSLAIKADGTLWAWGHNGYDQLGDGTTTTRYSPVQIGSAHTWVTVAGGHPFLPRFASPILYPRSAWDVLLVRVYEKNCVLDK